MEKSEKVIASCRNKGVSSLHKPLSLFFIQDTLEVMLLCPVIGWGAWISELWDANKGLCLDCRAAGSKPAWQDGTRAAPLPDSASPKEGARPPELIPPLLGAEGWGELAGSFPPSAQWDCFYAQCHTALALERKGSFWIIGSGKGKSHFGLYVKIWVTRDLLIVLSSLLLSNCKWGRKSRVYGAEAWKSIFIILTA